MTQERTPRRQNPYERIGRALDSIQRIINEGDGQRSWIVSPSFERPSDPEIFMDGNRQFYVDWRAGEIEEATFEDVLIAFAKCRDMARLTPADISTVAEVLAQELEENAKKIEKVEISSQKKISEEFWLFKKIRKWVGKPVIYDLD